MRAVAIVAARNGEIHIARCLSDLLDDGIDVVLIDNDSTDSTIKLASPFLGSGLLSIERLPWTGVFSLTAQLEAKKSLMAALPHDWVLHVDVDEWLRSPWPGVSLIDALKRVEAAGCNCINFDEMTFVAWPNEDFCRADYAQLMRTYYFFEPAKLRLMRAWRRAAGLDNIAHGGHRLTGDTRLFPQAFTLRHYMGLSADYVFRKYTDRVFDSDELARGWHHDRTGRHIGMNRCKLRPAPYLKTLPSWDSSQFDRTNPARNHYWQWSEDCPSDDD